MRAFLGEHRPHAAVAILRAATQCCFLQAPRGGLGVQITDVFELAGSKKSVAYKTDGAFYAPFFVAARDRHRARLEPIMGGQLQERRMEANRLGAPLEHRTFEVVIKDDPWDRTPGGKCLDVAAQEVVHRAVQIEAQ